MQRVAIAIAVQVMLLVPSLAAAVGCPEGQATSPDTDGHCCWPAQVWARSRNACIGIPQCPAGFTAQGERCERAGCPAGQAITEDTAGHCCWPGQAWSKSRAACVGVPQCPTGLAAQGEACVPGVLGGVMAPPVAQPSAPPAAVVVPPPPPAQPPIATAPPPLASPPPPPNAILVPTGEGCPIGRLRSLGHCCWPGETWNEDDHQCDGDAMCPNGFAEIFGNCTPVAEVHPLFIGANGAPLAPGAVATVPPPGMPAAPGVATPVPGTYPPPMAAAPYTDQVVPVPVRRPTQRKPLTALAVAGGATFGGLWIISAIVGGVYGYLGVLNADNCNYPVTNAYLAVPLVGGIFSVTEFNKKYGSRGCTASMAPLAYADVALQSAGLAAMIIGLSIYRDVPVGATLELGPKTKVRVALLPQAGPTGGGLAVGGSF